MNRILFLIVSCFFSMGIYAQNLQLHYDLGKTKDGNKEISRQYITSTIEYFRPDKHGSTFFFIDMDYDMDNGGVKLSYWEISRDMHFGKFPLEAHIEFTGGNFVDNSTNFGGYIGRSWIVGVNYPVMIGDFALSGAALYRQFKNAESPDWQFTGTWFGNFFNDKLTITGFIDIWSQDKFDSNAQPDGKSLLILSEPQFWYNINKTFSIGSEIEISRKFVTQDGDVDIMPTIAVKWNM